MKNGDVIYSPGARHGAFVIGVRDFFVDKRFVAGTILGLSLLAGGYALSAASGSSGASSDPSSELLSEQESAFTEQTRRAALDCAEGKEGLGAAINGSLKAHLEIASAMPNVEQLFDVNADCFSGLSSLIDLSFAIPSLASILSAAQNAVMAYAKKKVCSAVSRVTSMVTSPINQAIGQANQYVGGLNGLTANLNTGGGLAMIDPNLGSAYNVGQSGTYTTGQPFVNNPQTPVGDSTGGSTGSGNYNRVQQLTQQLGEVQASLGPAQRALGQAQQAYDSCQQMLDRSCDTERTSLEAARQNVQNIQDQIISLQNQINALLGNTAATSSSYAPMDSPAPVAPATKQTLTQKLGNLFQ